MTLRAILLGLIGVVAVCGFTYFNDNVMRQTFLVGNHLPLAIYGAFVLFVLFLNPLILRAGRQLALRGPELAVILLLVLASCVIPGSGLMRSFSAMLLLPFHQEQRLPAWREYDVLAQVPARLLPDVRNDRENKVLEGYVQGLGTGARHIALSDVPWRAWVRPLAFWLPLVLLLWSGLLALSVVLHRQWSDHEQLAYPIATFANAMLPRGRDLLSGVVRERLFWMAMLPVLCIHLNNYACKWFPNLVPVQLFVGLWPLRDTLFFPALLRGGGAGWVLMWPGLYFAVIGLAYFLPADVSLAVGLGPYLWYILVGLLAGYGIVLGGAAPRPDSFLAIGSYLGAFLVLLYTGRQYYMQVLRGVIGLRAGTEARGEPVWAARLFLAVMLVLTLYLSLLTGLDWQIAVIFLSFAVIIFVVMSRMLAETGVFFLSPGFDPAVLLLGIFGAAALGPQALLVASLLSTMLFVGAREAFMPYIVNALKVIDLQQVRISRAAWAVVLALLVGLAVAVPVTFYFQYDRGVNVADGWLFTVLPVTPFNTVVEVEQRLQAQNLLEPAREVSGWGHFRDMEPRPGLLVALAIGIGAMLLLTAGRLRCPKWPIHPVVLLLWSAWPTVWMAFSFLVGWLIKVSVAHYGGGRLYQRLKPLAIGLIAGELLAALFTILIGLVYYLCTGQLPPSFSLMPG